MTKDDIIRMAREANCEETFGTDTFLCTVVDLERFATLVAAHKAEVALAEAYLSGHLHGMEAAAVICENLPMQRDTDVWDECAAAIRARGTP